MTEITKSPYADYLPNYYRSLAIAFRNQFNLSGEIPNENDIVPGERYGTITIETLDIDRQHPSLQNNRLGVNTRVLRGAIALQIAVSAAELNEMDTHVLVEGVALQEMINLDHGIYALNEIIPGDFGFVGPLRVEGPIDRLLSQSLSGDKYTWIITMTCQIAMTVQINRDAYGRHMTEQFVKSQPNVSPFGERGASRPKAK
jgi:hypothetical protein